MARSFEWILSVTTEEGEHERVGISSNLETFKRELLQAAQDINDDIESGIASPDGDEE